MIMTGRALGLTALCALATFLALASVGPAVAAAQEQASAADVASKLPASLAERLTPAQQKTYLAYREARGAYERVLGTYWRKVEGKRGARRARRALGQAFTADDYITTFPPKYQGPELPADIAKIVAQAQPPQPDRGLPTVADFLSQAKKQFAASPRSAPPSGNSSAATPGRRSRSASARTRWCAYTRWRRAGSAPTTCNPASIR